ncbi:hypothetical protein ERO13_D01G092850v2 [Gossypium hirsutum]|nr:hypothetical protein ERO13_D01G092850v2 [Gossypium hirsutum]
MTVILSEIGFGCFKGSAPIALDKGMSSFSTWTIGQKQNPNLKTSTPWCKLLSQSTLVSSNISLRKISSVAISLYLINS